MKILFTILMTVSLSPMMTWAQVSSGETVYSLFSQYDQKKAAKFSEKVKKWPVENIKQRPGYLSFTVRGIPLVYKWVGKKGVALTLNNHAITFKQLKSKKLLNRKMRALLRPVAKKRTFSLMDLILPKAHAADFSSFLGKKNATQLALLSLLQGQGNQQPSYNAFSKGLFSDGPQAMSGELGKFLSFLTLSAPMVTSAFAGTMLDINKDQKSFLSNIKSPSTIYIPSVGEGVSVKNPIAF